MVAFPFRLPQSSWAGILIALCIWIPFCTADVITFQGGDQLHGQIYRQDEQFVAIRLVAGGDIVVSRELIRSIAMEPPEVFHVKRGDFFLSRGDFDQATGEYAQALQLNPGQGWIEEKINQLKIEKNKISCNALIEQADRYLAQYAYRKAIGSLLEATQICQDGEINQQIRRKLALAQSQLAFHYFNHCFEELALDELAKAEQYDPYVAHIYYVLGRVNHSQNRLQTARREYQRALELDPTLQQAKDFLLRLDRDSRRFQGM